MRSGLFGNYANYPKWDTYVGGQESLRAGQGRRTSGVQNTEERQHALLLWGRKPSTQRGNPEGGGPRDWAVEEGRANLSPIGRISLSPAAPGSGRKGWRRRDQ